MPYGKPIHDRLRLEICRGCSAGCRFCQAGIIYRPIRERKTTDLIKNIKKSSCLTGYDEVSLLSLSTGDYSNILPLIKYLIEKKFAVSLPSIRANRLTKNMMEQIKNIRKTGFTIAPEAGSQRLRDVINKGLSEEEIITAVDNAFGLGWKIIKLYFMIGLPTETFEDIKEIEKIIRKIAKHKKKINVSITIFIPKSHTPFQYEKQIDIIEAKEKFFYLQNSLKNLRFVNLKLNSPFVGKIEAFMAKGDRRLANIILDAYKNGAKFDAWSDKFNFSIWEKAIEKSGIDIDTIIHKEIDENKPLVWEHIDCRISKEFLIKERKKAYKKERSFDCKNGKCLKCGICDFKKIKPIIVDKIEIIKEENNQKKENNI